MWYKNVKKEVELSNEAQVKHLAKSTSVNWGLWNVNAQCFPKDSSESEELATFVSFSKNVAASQAVSS